MSHIVMRQVHLSGVTCPVSNGTFFGGEGDKVLDLVGGGSVIKRAYIPSLKVLL